MTLQKFQPTIKALVITVPTLLLAFFIIGAALEYGEWRKDHSIHLQNWIVIEPTKDQPSILIKTVEAKNATEIKLSPQPAANTANSKK